MKGAEVQVIGTRKCRDTRNAIRFFAERGIRVHFRDIGETPLSAGELRNIARNDDFQALVDTASREYERRGLAHMSYDPYEEILATPAILKTPIVRRGNRAVVGFDPAALEALARE